MSSFEQMSDRDTKGAFLTRKYIRDIQGGDGGPIDTLLATITVYINENLAKFKQSEASTGTSVTVFQYFPQQGFDIPSIVLEATNVQNDINWIGSVYTTEEDKKVRTIRANIDVTFDVFGRNTREKNAMSGWLQNALFRGLYDGELTKHGIRHIEFVRSVDRGYDQADRVLQFHTHSVSADIIFRQLVTYRFVFDWLITPRTDEGWSTPYYIGTTKTDYNSEGETDLIATMVYLPINLAISNP